jgi:hypothetical protein
MMNKLLARSKKTPKKSSQHYNHYTIERIQILPPFTQKSGSKMGM